MNNFIIFGAYFIFDHPSTTMVTCGSIYLFVDTQKTCGGSHLRSGLGDPRTTAQRSGGFQTIDKRFQSGDISCMKRRRRGVFHRLARLSVVLITAGEILSYYFRPSKEEVEDSSASVALGLTNEGKHRVVRKRWVERQDTLAALQFLSMNISQFGTDYLSEFTTTPPLLEGNCAMTGALRNYSQICSSVAHRQKPTVQLVISEISWLSSEMNTGKKDCAASVCSVSVGAGHTESSHILLHAYPGGNYNTTRIHDGQVSALVQLEANILDVKSVAGDINWLASHRQGDYPTSRWIPLSYINSDVYLFRALAKHSKIDANRFQFSYQTAMLVLEEIKS